MFDRNYFEEGSYGKQEAKIIQRNYYHLLNEATRVFPKIFSNRYHRYKILDFGCGYGAGTYFLSKYFPNSLIIAIDISLYAIEKAKRLYPLRNIVYLTLDLANRKSLELLRSYTNDEDFDIIFTRDVLEHIPVEKHHLYIEAFASILKIDGIIVAQTPNKYNILAHIIDRTHIGLGTPHYWYEKFSRYFSWVKIKVKQYVPIIWKISKRRIFIEFIFPLLGFNIYIFARK